METAELKAIREYLLHVRMNDWLQPPEEALWLDVTLRVFIRVLRSLWKEGADLSDVSVKSDWILEQIDLRGWAHCFGAEVGDNIVKTVRGAYIRLLLTPPFDAPPDVKEAYWEWVEDRVLTPIKDRSPDLYAWMIEQERTQISNMAEMDITNGGQNDK
jgi:hypothetical protein